LSILRHVVRGFIVIGFGILVGLLIFPQFQEADAQRSTRQMLQELEREGITNCEIWQINEFLYKPVRIALIHERVDAHEVKITSEDPASEVNWVGSKEDFRLVTDSAGQHTAQVILDYELKHEEPRQVFFQVFAQGNVLMMEGNWVHEGFNFCKIIDFTTTEAPTQLTPEEIQEENNKFNSEFRSEVAEQNTTVENGLLVITIVVLVVGIGITIYFIIIIISMTGMAKVSKRPAKKLNEMIETIRKLAEVLRLQTQFGMTRDNEMKDKILKKVDDSLRDLSIMASGTKQKIELAELFPTAESLVSNGEKPVSEVLPEPPEPPEPPKPPEPPEEPEPTEEAEKSHGKKELISSVKERIISVMEKKDSITNSNDVMQKYFDSGTTKSEVKEILVKEYMKIPYKEAREIYEKMNKDYAKKITLQDAIRVEAMMERIVRSDR